MDEAAAAAYAEDLAGRAPAGGRGGLGFEANAGSREKRKGTKAEKELLGSLKGHTGGLASMQTTVARAITHGNANFDPWKKPVKSCELHVVTTNKRDLYAHFQSAGVLTGNEQTKASQPHGVPLPSISDKAMLKAIKKALKAHGGPMPSKALRKSVVSLLFGCATLGSEARAAAKAQLGRVIEVGAQNGKWNFADNVVTLSRKRSRSG